MSHPIAKLTPEERRLVVERVRTHGWTPAQTAEAMGVAPETVCKWLRRYAQEGDAGLLDRPSRPHTSPKATPLRTVKRTLGMRRRLRLGAGHARTASRRCPCRSPSRPALEGAE